MAASTAHLVLRNSQALNRSLLNLHPGNKLRIWRNCHQWINLVLICKYGIPYRSFIKLVYICHLRSCRFLLYSHRLRSCPPGQPPVPASTNQQTDDQRHCCNSKYFLLFFQFSYSVLSLLVSRHYISPYPAAAPSWRLSTWLLRAAKKNIFCLRPPAHHKTSWRQAALPWKSIA